MTPRRAPLLCLALLLAQLSTPEARAALLNPLDPYGLHSRHMATARAGTPFAPDFTATLSNPAALAAAESQVSLGYLFARPTLTLDAQSVAATSNNVPLVGLRLDLSALTQLKREIGFGLAIGLDDNLQSLLTVSDAPSATGQFLREGRRQLLLAAGLGVEIVPWARVGAGVLLSVAATANLEFRTSLAGETSREAMAMDVGPRFAPVLGLVLGPWDLGPVKAVQFASSFRAASWQGVRVVASAEATLGSSPLTTLPLEMSFLDAYRPLEVAGGVQFVVGPVTGNLAIEYSRWQPLGAQLDAEDTVRGNTGLTFSDTVSPRVGAELALPRGFVARAGYAYEPSPLESSAPSDLNAVDNARHLLGLGGGYTLPGNTFLFRQPLSLDLAYQAQLLNSRSLTLLATDGSTVEARAAGQVHALNVTLTMRF